MSKSKPSAQAARSAKSSSAANAANGANGASKAKRKPVKAQAGNADKSVSKPTGKRVSTSDPIYRGYGGSGMGHPYYARTTVKLPPRAMLRKTATRDLAIDTKPKFGPVPASVVLNPTPAIHPNFHKTGFPVYGRDGLPMRKIVIDFPHAPLHAEQPTVKDWEHGYDPKGAEDWEQRIGKFYASQSAHHKNTPVMDESLLAELRGVSLLPQAENHPMTDTKLLKSKSSAASASSSTSEASSTSGASKLQQLRSDFEQAKAAKNFRAQYWLMRDIIKEREKEAAREGKVKAAASSLSMPVKDAVSMCAAISVSKQNAVSPATKKRAKDFSLKSMQRAASALKKAGLTVTKTRGKNSYSIEPWKSPKKALDTLAKAGFVTAEAGNGEYWVRLQVTTPVKVQLPVGRISKNGILYASGTLDSANVMTKLVADVAKRQGE